MSDSVKAASGHDLAQAYDFDGKVADAKVDITPLPLSTLQTNITRLCNQACVHCHVDASPRRREMMSKDAMAQCLTILDQVESIDTLDITGGAPELHPDFRWFVQEARARGKKVIVRHNLTVTLDPHPLTKESNEDLPEFFKTNDVEVVSSLPYYQEFFTDKQRGSGVFQKSIKALQMLNEVGYGREGTGRILNLVYNPVGAFLPPTQEELERDYKRELDQRFGIHFNSLFVITNMPIHRFKVQLKRLGGYEEYMEKLVSAFNPSAAAGVMCRNLVSVDWDGRISDCDFNQMMGLSVDGGMTLDQFDAQALERRKIVTGDHCFGCTAGAGSSCGGNTA